MQNTASGDYSAIPGGYNLQVGARSFGFSGQTSATQTDLSSVSNIAAFVDVDLWLYNVRNQASQLRLYEPSGSGTNYTAFRAQAQSADITYTLPARFDAGDDAWCGAVADRWQWEFVVGKSIESCDSQCLEFDGEQWDEPGDELLGTTDAQPLVIRVDNQETFRFNTNS